MGLDTSRVGRQKGRTHGRAGLRHKQGRVVHLVKSWLTVVDGLAVLRVQQKPAQHQRMVLCCNVPYGEEVAQAL